MSLDISFKEEFIPEYITQPQKEQLKLMWGLRYRSARGQGSGRESIVNTWRRRRLGSSVLAEVELEGLVRLRLFGGLRGAGGASGGDQLHDLLLLLALLGVLEEDDSALRERLQRTVAALVDHRERLQLQAHHACRVLQVVRGRLRLGLRAEKERLPQALVWLHLDCLPCGKLTLVPSTCSLLQSHQHRSN